MSGPSGTIVSAGGLSLPPRAGRRSRWRSRGSLFLLVLHGRPSFALGYVIVTAVMTCAILAPWIAPYDPVTANPDVYLSPPGFSHWLGTDNTGMDILSRILFAPRTDLTIAVLGTALSAMVGIPLGAIVGYYEGRSLARRTFSVLVMRAADVLQAFPVFVFAIALVAVFGQSIISVVVAIAFVNIPIYLRLMRSQVLSIRGMRYVDAAFVAGSSDFAILRRHILPNAIAAALAQLSVNIGWSVLLTAGLSFVGAGVVAPTPEWGSMIATGYQNVTTGQWWPSVFPGVALGLTVFGFALIGNSIEVMADPAQLRLVGRAGKGG
ncbi:ABC transporter permease [Lichenifustis flavocetrariae]|uniref:ABC transporter permease n=1 Tax=Lichenifustis flavocetrariae TaxID=2949735 RepID=A0AA41Z6H7_9HYPH|nr:ABC transporter permease [Lichenifustis flavocetrariae]MCW6510167.1 ABC transporter permease [Lichenifustis flavocetrariae]